MAKSRLNLWKLFYLHINERYKVNSINRMYNKGIEKNDKKLFRQI